jgi:hypothetical protein
MVDIRISYSSTYGYPESVYIDFVKLIADEELSFSVVRLEPAQHQEDLDAAESLWLYSTRSTRMDYNYRYTVTQDGEADLHRTVEVREDFVTGVHANFPIAGQEVDDPADFPTVHGLFDKIQEAINDEVTELAVIYDGTYGYPVEISILQDDSKVIIKVDRMTLYTIAAWDLDDAMGRWNELEFTDYDYAVQVFCYCQDDYVRPKRVEVRDDTIVSVTFLETEDGINAGIDVMYLEIEQVQTVDSIFTRIRNAITGYAAIIDATYHSTYGYPLEVFIDLDNLIDLDSLIADDEIGIHIFDFSPLRFTVEEDAATLLIGPVPPALPAPPLPDQEYFNLALSYHDDLCIGLKRNSASIGSTVKLMQCDTSSLRQQFGFSDGMIYLGIVGDALTKCLQAGLAGPARDGGRISIQYCDPDNEQQKFDLNWQDSSGGSISLATSPNLCVANVGDTINNGDTMLMKECDVLTTERAKYKAII